MPAITHEALVQVDMAVHQAWQDGKAAQIDAFRTFARRAFCVQAADASVADVEMQRCTVAIHAATDELKRHRKLPQSQVMAPSCAPGTPIGQRNIWMPCIHQNDECRNDGRPLPRRAHA
ncbi:hypothetical protein G6F57_011480 [Rhizopus arrhizus]|nr:hypothetical protein G6F57_011480 [Rhizopus arrhizus]